jgi:DNA-binding response OmpR family regulator
VSDRPRVLVVDDEPGIREGCRRVLTTEGFDVETAGDGVSALESFKAYGDFSLALVDLRLPRMDGMALIQALHEIDPDLVVLVITAYATIDTAVAAAKIGAYSYIPKPFSPRDLLLPVKNGLEKRALSLEARRLREEKEKYLHEVTQEPSRCRTIINSMTDGVLVVNRAREIVLRNAAAAQMVPACAGLSLPASVSAMSCPDLCLAVEKTLESNNGPIYASRRIAHGEKTYMVNVSPILEGDGATSGAVAVFRDISDLV